MITFLMLPDPLIFADTIELLFVRKSILEDIFETNVYSSNLNAIYLRAKQETSFVVSSTSVMHW